jgi:hypothetical protein
VAGKRKGFKSLFGAEEGIGNTPSPLIRAGHIERFIAKYRGNAKKGRA